VAVAGWWIVLKHNLVLARPAAGAHFILQIYIYIQEDYLAKRNE
jgi:hypothetical protein